MRVGLLLLLLVALLTGGCGGDDDEAAGGGETTAPVAPVATNGGVGGCETVDAPEPRGNGTGTAPTEPLSADETHEVVVETNCGAFTIRLDQEASPKTTASFAALVEDGFFDDTVFHRIVPSFVIQGGDPTGTGTGGPGYSTVDTPAPGTTYTKGVVAMAKTAAEAPGTAGSQFFVVTAADAGLPPEYAVLGEVTEGLDVVDRIGALGGPDEVPTQAVVVESMTLRTS